MNDGKLQMLIGKVEKVMNRHKDARGKTKYYPNFRVRLPTKLVKKYQLNEGDVVYILPVEWLNTYWKILTGKHFKVDDNDPSEYNNSPKIQLLKEVVARAMRRRVKGKLYESARISLVLPRQYINKRFRIFLEEL